MWGAYLFQITNLATAMLIVPLLLLRLGASEYALWLLFTSIMGATTQVQNGLQGVAVKQIAIGFHRGNRADFLGEIDRMRRHYRIFATLIAGPVLLITALYFQMTQPMTFESHVAWALLVLSYAASYWYSPNNAILMATDRVGLNGAINSASRIIFFLCTVAIISLFPSLIAPCVGLSIAVLFGAIGARRHAQKQIDRFHPDCAPFTIPQYRGNVRRYTLYTFSAFMLYTGSLLFVAPLFPEITASYGLALQMSALTVTMAIVPAQAWLARLVRSDRAGARRELQLTAVACNGLYVTGYSAVILLAPPALKFIGADVALPDWPILALMGLAFLLELNIAVMVNHLTANINYTFAVRYALVAGVGLILGTAVAAASGLAWLGFLVVPMTLQATFTLPFMVRKVARAPHVSEPT